MMRHSLRARLAAERGFTLIEILVVTVLVGIVAAIALAVFLNQADKGRDAGAKSNATNLARMVESCNAALDDRDDFRECDTRIELGDSSIRLDSAAPAVTLSDCDDSDPGPIRSGEARVAQSSKDCFVVLAGSISGNRFWLVKHNDGSITRNCTTHGVNGCPADGQWAG